MADALTNAAVAGGPSLLDVLRVTGALGFVLALVFLAGRLLRRGLGQQGQRRLTIEERVPLTRHVQLITVRVEHQRLLLSVSERGAQLVTPLEALAEQPIPVASPDQARHGQPALSASFAEALSTALGARMSAMVRGKQ